MKKAIGKFARDTPKNTARIYLPVNMINDSKFPWGKDCKVVLRIKKRSLIIRKATQAEAEMGNSA